jgi:hypothetical protein
VVLEPVAKLGVGFAYAGKDYLVSCSAGLERAEQFAAAGNIETDTTLRHQPADAKVGIGLEAIADERLDGGERALELIQVMEERSLTIDEQRRAVSLGELGHGHLFTMQDSVPVVKIVHVIGN